ncbi:MAG TPA: cation-transporting P-type ATPase [Acidimicrobiia bacterium]|nr:cation-transporting P-type ATPase [Acidimicrobiia bacterium]
MTTRTPNDDGSMAPQATAEQRAWYALEMSEVAGTLGVTPRDGLSSNEAQSRLASYGPNRLAEKKKETGWQAFLRQYRDLMQIILLTAAVVNVVVTGVWSTTIVLLALTVFNAVLGLRQESKAEASLAALSETMKNIARVRRDGEAIEVDAGDLVPGDIVLVEAGNVVPADGRLFVTATLEIEEAALTGESTPTLKVTDAIPGSDVGLGDRLNMAFMNTSVTRGRGEFIVTATGMDTEIGHIAELLNQTEADKTPLQKQLDRLTVIISGLAGLAFLAMVILGLVRDQDLDTIFVSGVALAISAIPTGLPAVVTTMYSMGTRALAAMNAIVKRLPSVETLGSVSAICSDKTGTLTLNKMTAVEMSVPGRNRYSIRGEGYSTSGEILHAGGADLPLDDVMLPMALCADARLDGENLIGDPTEGALIVLAEKGGIHIDSARQMYPRVAEVPFDSEYKFMATFHAMKDDNGRDVVRCFAKGAPDVLIARSGHYWEPGGTGGDITEDNRSLALAENERMASQGERVMVVARRDFDPNTFDPRSDLIGQVTDLTLLAMVGIVDPPRAEAKDAIAKCHSAGIQVRMITGDHAVTAAAIGHQLGIEGTALTGAEFAALSDEELAAQLDEIGVVARVAPEDKIRLVSMLQSAEHVVAMTGDGVNDAPALKKADIGVAMGITGTEVSKDAAVMILTDDNFSTIVKAVEFGRAIYNNLFGYIRFQMTALVGFIVTYLLAAIFLILGGIPFTPLVVLWINFLIQVPIAITLGFGKAVPGLMERKPRPLRQPILNRSQWIRVTVMGLLMAIGTIVLESVFDDTATAATMGFVVFSLFNIVLGPMSRSETESAFNREIISESTQLLLIGAALLLTVLPTQLEFLRGWLGLTGLTGNQWLIALGAALVFLMLDEVIKVFLRRRLGPVESPPQLRPALAV